MHVQILLLPQVYFFFRHQAIGQPEADVSPDRVQRRFHGLRGYNCREI